MKVKNCSQNLNLMFPSANNYHSTYILSECSVKQFVEKLFNRNQLLPQFSCLADPKETVIEKIQKSYNSIILHNHLPGYFFSMSDQCRLITNDPSSYSCRNFYLPGQCAKLMCSINGICNSHTDEVLDGTACGKDKICLFSECVNIENKKTGELRLYLSI